MDAQILGMIQRCAQDVQGELAGLSNALRKIPHDQLGPHAQPQLNAALLHAEAMGRMMHGVLAQVQAVTADTGPARPEGVLTGRRVLVADDAEANLDVLMDLLSGAGADVALARSGTLALDCLRAEGFDLFITSATMPDFSGAQLIRALRNRPGALAETPALAMTPDISVVRHDELIAAGANRVITRPLPDPAEMLRIVVRLMRVAPAAAPVPSAGDEVALFDPAPLTQVCRLAGPETGREILDRLILDLVETLARLDRVGAGLQAGQGPGADLSELRATTRVLIALAGTAGALLLLQKVQKLDRRLQDETRPLLPVDLNPLLAEIRLLTRGAVAAIARLPVPDAGDGRAP